MNDESQEPLAARIRPKNLNEFVGQAHLVGEGKPLRVAIEKRHRFSFVLWGPPGVGKTTLARIYAESIGARFYELSAVSAGKDDIRRIIDEKDGAARKDEKSVETSRRELGAHAPSSRRVENAPKVLFLDEIHRFNKSQQDFLLPFVESGEIALVGATTENPSFEVIPALLSRCRVFVLEPLSAEEMAQILARAKVKLAKPAREWLVAMANGDARAALGVLESSVNLYGDASLDHLKEALQSKFLRYDKKGEEHYNVISAFIKSMRASDPDAAVYYLARMIDAGEDPEFIARRMVIFASEDIGLAQPTALVVANAVFEAVTKIGLPEARISLAHGACYLAEAKKDRRAYDAIGAAQDDVKKFGNLPVPLHLRNAPTKLMKDLGYGSGYEKYPPGSSLPEKLKGKRYLG